MKLFDKKSLILLISVVSINILCIISVSYAYFTANIIGNDKAEDMVVTAGTMKITYTDSNEVTLNNALPGDTVIKQFKIENTGTLDTKYNIKLIVEENNFIDKEDLVVTLKRNDKDNVTNIVPVEKEGYILIDEPLELKGVHNYTLTLNFKKDESNQNDNVNKKVKFKIGVDSETDVELYEYSYSKDNTFYAKLKEAEESNNAAYDDFGNIRYIGKDPNNYIWFNCLKYDDLTNDNAEDEEHNCEKWRVIGLMSDIERVNEDESTTKEYLTKIIRADIVGNMAWDTTGGQYGSNNWTRPADLKTNLESYYNGSEINGCADVDCSGETITTKGIKPTTKNMIEYVIWNLGGWITNGITAQQFYEKERGEIIPSGASATWPGYIGLMYVSDYGYATTGSNDGSKDRASCLSTTLYSYNNESYCYEKDWLYISGTYQWTLTPWSNTSAVVFRVYPGGGVSDNNAYLVRGVRPSLYLKSNVTIKGGNGSTEPYVLVP